MKPESHQLLLSSIRRLIRAGRIKQLRRVVDRAHPADLAYLFGALTPGQRIATFDAIAEDRAAGELLSELEPGLLDPMLEELSDDRLVELLSAMASDDAADVMHHLDTGRKDRLLEKMSAEDQSEATSLMGYDPESAGGLMSTEFVAVAETTTASEAIRQLQEDTGDLEVVFYLYVVNEHGQLVGVVSLRELVRQPRSRPLAEFMIRDVIRVKVDDDQEEVARLVARYNLLGLPVIDASNQLVGVVTVDDIIDVIRHEATEDMLRMAGAGEADLGMQHSSWRTFWSRLPWLVPSLVAGTLGLVVVAAYETTLHAVLPLVALIPIIMGMAGNIGTQSSTVVTRGIAIGKLEGLQLGRIVLKELSIGVAAGVTYGALIGIIGALYFAGHPAVEAAGAALFGVTTGVAVVASMALAAALGAGVPLVFERLGLDPARATGPFVTTTIDVLAVWLYLATAAVLLV